MEDIKEIETETENAADTIVEISETKSTQPHNGHVESETKSDRPTKPHNGENIDKIIVSQYIEDDPYVVTYSKEDSSILGWSVNIEEIGQQQPDVYFKLDKDYNIRSFVLYKKILVFSYYYDHKRSKYLF
jgi:hypothetical protein